MALQGGAHRECRDSLVDEPGIPNLDVWTWFALQYFNPRNQRIYNVMTNLSGMFSDPASKFDVVSVEPGIVVVTFVCTQSMVNATGNMHGGLYALLADELTTFAMLVDPNNVDKKFGTSVHLAHDSSPVIFVFVKFCSI